MELEPIGFIVLQEPTLDLLVPVGANAMKSTVQGAVERGAQRKKSATGIVVIADGDDEMFWVGHELGVVQINWPHGLTCPRNVEKKIFLRLHVKILYG